MTHQMIAPCLFGLEALVADELKEMGAQSVLAENGRVLFSGDDAILARANIGSRYAERILLSIGTFDAHSFTELFDKVKALPWEKYIDKNDAFPVKGWSLKSTLHSVPDCQSIIKKAMVDRLSAHYHVGWLAETGVKKQISFSIMKDRVTVTMDTSGEGLHKRGYRRNATEAPIKETLAAAMVKLSRIYDDSQLYDPFCGSGTLLIEGLLLAKNIAPGLQRRFAAEQFDFIDSAVWSKERMRAQDAIRHGTGVHAYASDIDPEAVQLTLENARKAGVEQHLSAIVADIQDFAPATERAVVITNPPYGERLLDLDAARKLYRMMGKVFQKQRGYRYTVISPDEEFERQFGRPADKRRKLYNGSIKCQLYLYFKA